MKLYQYPSVLTIAGFDGSGGAGIQADIKTISALGCYATSALTALPVQNTTGVHRIYPIPVTAVKEQIEAVMDDIRPSAIKIGMVHTAELVETIVQTLSLYPKIPIVFDPVMVSTSGHRLIEEETIAVIVEKLFPITCLITPNMDEAAMLAHCEVKNVSDLRAAGAYISTLGCSSILLKGGHQDTDVITSLFVDVKGDYHPFDFRRIKTRNMHGSGCTLSSAIAAYLAQGCDLYDAVDKGQQYVYEAIAHAKDVVIGKGNGPLNHFYEPQKMIKNELV